MGTFLGFLVKSKLGAVTASIIGYSINIISELVALSLIKYAIFEAGETSLEADKLT